jgi:hypothetical protein
MINVLALGNKLAGLVGFKQPYNPAYANIDADNLASRSGEIVNDNPFVKIEVIKDSNDYADISAANFNLYLKEKIRSATVMVLNAVFNIPDFLERKIFYPDFINKTTSVVLPVGFHGYKIKSCGGDDLAFTISRVMMDFDTTGNITLVLLNSSNPNVAIKTQTINVTSKFQEAKLDWVVNTCSGEYYLGYFQGATTLKPYERKDFCSTIKKRFTHLDVEEVNYPSFTSLGSSLDTNIIESPLDYNGLNFDISVYKDYTDFAIQNEILFARAINLQTQISLLMDTVASLSSNRNKRVGDNYAAQIMTQIEGEDGENNVKVKGLRPQFFGAIASIRKEIDKMKSAKLGIDQFEIATYG